MDFITINGQKVRLITDRRDMKRGLIRYPYRAYRDPWRAQTRVMRYRGSCAAGCGRAVWEFDDGENDPRGFLGDHAADDLTEEVTDMVVSIYGEAYRKWIVPTFACAMCANTEHSYKAAIRKGVLRSSWQVEREMAKAAKSQVKA
jgi:hypothetical protein